MYNTVTVQITNTNDKLSQQEWSELVSDLKLNIETYSRKVYFFGGSTSYDPWQNLVIVFALDQDKTASLINDLRKLKEDFEQDQITFTVGQTRFI